MSRIKSNVLLASPFLALAFLVGCETNPDAGKGPANTTLEKVETAAAKVEEKAAEATNKAAEATAKGLQKAGEAIEEKVKNAEAKSESK